MAVSVDEVTKADLNIPAPNHPFLTPEGTVNPIWYRYLSDVSIMCNLMKELVNAIKAEVDSQHP